MNDGGRFEVINPQCPTNVPDFLSNAKEIRDRQEDALAMIKLLHSDVHKGNKCDVLSLHGDPKKGTTSTALLVGEFFSRPWYDPIFPGGVWYVDMKNDKNLAITKFWHTIASTIKLKEAKKQFFYCNLSLVNNDDNDCKEQKQEQKSIEDSNDTNSAIKKVWHTIASSMKLKEAKKQLLSLVNNDDNDSKEQKQEQKQEPEPIKYSKDINEKLLNFEEKIKSNTIDNSYHYWNNYEHHFVFFKKAPNSLREKQKLEEFLRVHYDDVDKDEIDEIHKIVTDNRKANIDVSISLKNRSRRIKAQTFFAIENIDMEKPLLNVFGKDNLMLIIDHVKFDSKQDESLFLKKIETLVRRTSQGCKILLVLKNKYVNCERFSFRHRDYTQKYVKTVCSQQKHMDSTICVSSQLCLFLFVSCIAAIEP